MDLSTIGVKFGWAVETTAGTKPTAFEWVERCSKIAGITLTKDKIDVTCFEDTIKQYIGGVSDTGGDWNLNFNGSATFVTAWNALITAYETGTSYRRIAEDFKNSKDFHDIVLVTVASTLVVKQ